MLWGNLPKVSELRDVWVYEERPLIPGEYEDGVEPDSPRFLQQYHEKYERKMKLSLWYFDNYMTMIAGTQYWGNNVKKWFLPTDMMDLEGEQKVIVTITSEAFGFLLYENCRNKWIQIFKWKDQNPKSNKKSKPPPQYNKNKPETHLFKAKWSDNCTGQSMGWHPDAFKSYNDYIKCVNRVRELDLEAGSQIMLRARAMIREAHDYIEEKAQPARKRKRQNEEADGVSEAPAIPTVFVDE
jgi:hypothetical protein